MGVGIEFFPSNEKNQGIQIGCPDLLCRVLTEKMRSGKFQASIASYIESYNTQMPHRTLKNLTPCQVEENSIEKAE